MVGIFLICFLLNGVSFAENLFRESNGIGHRATIQPEGRALFNPRIEYNNNQWVPVGHSDPLKNDPTFDYSPPTLDRVRYWHESSDDNNNSVAAQNVDYNLSGKSEILLLGVPTKHTIYPKNTHHANAISQDPKANNRRSSSYYPPEPSRVLTPPPAQFNSHAYSNEYNFAPQQTQWNNDLPIDSSSDESASYLTVIKPKTSPNPFAATLYTKNARDSIYHLAANVNSLESDDRRKAWIQSLLQKEVTAQPLATSPQVILAHSPLVLTSPAPKTKRPFEHTTPSYFLTNTPATTTTTIRPLLATTLGRPLLPIRPPMHLIIQGHSKVKTYGIDKNGGKAIRSEPKMIPVGGNSDPVVKHITSGDVKANTIQVKHLHKIHTTQAPTKFKATANPNKGLLDASMDSLFGLLNSSLGFSLDDSNSDESYEQQEKVNSTKSSEIKVSTTKFTITGPTTLRPFNSSTPNGNINR